MEPLNLVLDRWWQDLVVERAQTDLKAVQDQVWAGWSAARPDKIRQAAGITDAGLLGFIKCLQLDSCLCYGVYDISWELVDPTTVRLTVAGTPALPPQRDLESPDTDYRAAWLELESLQASTTSFGELTVAMEQTDIGLVFTISEPGGEGVGFATRAEEEMADYTGPFRPELRYIDFTKERLHQLGMVYAGLGLDLDANWNIFYNAATSPKEAIDAEVALWAAGAFWWQGQTIASFGIEGEGVEAAMKTMQLDPQHMLMGLEMELVDDKTGRWVNRGCHAVEYSEATDDLYLQMRVCKLDWVAYQAAASRFSPDVEALPLVLPPRQGTDICCSWELRHRPGHDAVQKYKN